MPTTHHIRRENQGIPRDAFPPGVTEKLAYYVYKLIDPRSNKIFYVGKGKGNRIFAHVNTAIAKPIPSQKLEQIREIINQGFRVKYLIHRHGLTEKEAFEVEASLIDHIGLDELRGNAVSGLYAVDRGQMTVEEIVATYKAKPITITKPAILVILKKRYRRGMERSELYRAVQGNWVLGERRKKASYALAVYNKIVREAYHIERWEPVIDAGSVKTTRRWRFHGAVAQELYHYVGRSIAHYLTPGAQNPIKYVNC